MVAPNVEGIDLFNIAGRSISGWVPSLKGNGGRTGANEHVTHMPVFVISYNNPHHETF